MSEKEADKFLYRMQWIDHSIIDLEEAISLGMRLATKVDENTWFGEICDSDESILGTFYLSAAAGGQCRWFDHLSAEEASKFIIRELQENLS